MRNFKSLLGRDEVARHATASDCWVIISNEVFDVTKFLEEHPGGKRVILSRAGSDATHAYDAVHSRDLLAKYNAQMYVDPIASRGSVTHAFRPTMGHVALATAIQSSTAMPEESDAQLASRRRRLRRVINIDDFEAAAAEILPAKYFACK